MSEQKQREGMSPEREKDLRIMAVHHEKMRDAMAEIDLLRAANTALEIERNEALKAIEGLKTILKCAEEDRGEARDELERIRTDHEYCLRANVLNEEVERREIIERQRDEARAERDQYKAARDEWIGHAGEYANFHSALHAQPPGTPAGMRIVRLIPFVIPAGSVRVGYYADFAPLEDEAPRDDSHIDYGCVKPPEPNAKGVSAEAHTCKHAGVASIDECPYCLPLAQAPEPQFTDRERQMRAALRRIAFWVPTVCHQHDDKRYVDIEDVYALKRIAADARKKED